MPNGTSVSAAGTYTSTLTSVSGCDSVITTNLIVNPVYASTVNAQICSGGNYVLPNGTSVSAAGTYTSTLTSVSGCDSVITTNLIVNPVYASTVNAQICSGGNYVLPNGTSVSAAGTYNSTLTSVSGCDSVITTNLIVNPVYASTVNSQICSGGNYVLPNGTSVSAAGTYTSTLTSVSGCDSVITTNLSVNSVLTSTVNAQICSGGNYVLPNGTSVSAAGTYNSTLTSVSGCDSVITTILNVGSPAASESHNDAACGMANASINLTVSGGISPYNYAWSSGSTSQDINNLSQGIYFVTVTDNNSCQSILNVTINDINGPELTENHVNSSCGNSNGAVDLIVTGGVPPMSFAWNNAAISEDINNIPQGIYSVTVTDANNCMATLSLSIGGNNIPAVSETHVDANCGNNDGAVNITVAGGASFYTYNWNNGASTEDLNNISAGNYYVTVTDANNCMSILNVNISNMSSSILISETHFEPTCGQSNGSIDITVSGGVSPYQYEWDNNFTTEDLTGITGGNYEIEVEDALGCDATLHVFIQCISAPPCLLTVNATTINTSCSNPNDGGATLIITNSTSVLTYNWSNGSTTQNLTGLNAGNYSVTVNDGIGCSVIASVVVLNTNGPSVTDNHSNTSCGLSNGFINLISAGGTPPYNYAWNNGSTNQNLTSLSAGDYFVTVIDANNCQATLNVFIENSTATTLSETHTNASCGNNNGAIDLTMTSGVAPYGFSWNTGGTAEDPTNMPAGNYIVTVTDAFACSISASITISNSNGQSINETHVDASCSNNNGSVNLTIAGGTSPYSYNWNNSETTQDISNLMSGNYLVTVTDANNCIAIMNVMIDNLSGPTLNVVTTNQSCGQSNGSIDLQVSGGLPPYIFNWINGATASLLNNLSAGNYAVTVSDQSGCSLFTTTSIISTSAPVINLNSFSSTICAGNATTINSIGATTYAWSPATGLNVTTGNNVVANPTTTTTYTVTGNTAGGCSASSTIVITVSAGPNISVVPATSFICVGGSTTITANGAATYSWSPSASLSSATSATVTASPNITTTYTVTGISNGCITQTTAVVNLISATTINLNSTDTTICLGNSVVITASGSGTNYSWSPSTGLSATTGNSVSANPTATTVYNVVSTNAGGCSSSASVLVNVNSLPTINVSANNNNICAGGTVVMNASGAGTYSWSPSTALNVVSGPQVIASPTSSITYTVTGIDGTTGCEAQSTNAITVVNAPSVTVSASSTSICPGQNSVLTANGASAYAWYPATGLNVSNGGVVIANPDSTFTYMVVGSVPTGCTDTAIITISVVTLPDVIVDVLPDEGCEPLTVTFENHTTGAASFNWSFGDNNTSTTTSPVHTYNSQGNYPVTLVVTSLGGCSDTLNNLATIKVHHSPVADFTVEPGLGIVTTINDATFSFLNHSTDADHYRWFFGDGATDTFKNLNHTYVNAGEFNVTLIATADYGCADTITQYPILIVEDGTVFIPNAFTPNGDGMNDVFNIFGTGIRNYTLSIFDRIGELVYEGDESSAGWDATFHGQPVNTGVFFYVAFITYDDGTKANKKGDVTVVR